MSGTLLLVGGGIESVPAINKAHSLGLTVVVSDMNDSAPAAQMADFFIEASTYDVEATVTAATRFSEKISKVTGVICVGSDVPLTVATVAKKLRLPGIPIESAIITSDKLLMKKRLSRDLIPLPFFKYVSSFEEVQELMSTSPFDLVQKPVDSRGSRGVLRLSKCTNIEQAFLYSKSFSPTGRVMVEEYLKGKQISSESIVINGVCYTVGLSDRNYEFLDLYAPHIIENGGHLPPLISEAARAEIDIVIQKVSESLGILNGIIKGDLVMDGDKPLVIEVASRLSGGYFCTHEIPLNSGVDLLGMAIKQAIGQKLNESETRPLFNKAVAQRYWFPNPGTVSSIDSLKKYQSHPMVKLLEIRVQPGDIIPQIENHPARAGVVITVGNKIQEAVNLAERIVQDVRINTVLDG